MPSWTLSGRSKWKYNLDKTKKRGKYQQRDFHRSRESLLQWPFRKTSRWKEVKSRRLTARRRDASIKSDRLVKMKKKGLLEVPGKDTLCKHEWREGENTGSIFTGDSLLWIIHPIITASEYSDILEGTLDSESNWKLHVTLFFLLRSLDENLPASFFFKLNKHLDCAIVCFCCTNHISYAYICKTMEYSVCLLIHANARPFKSVPSYLQAYEQQLLPKNIFLTDFDREQDADMIIGGAVWPQTSAFRPGRAFQGTHMCTRNHLQKCLLEIIIPTCRLSTAGKWALVIIWSPEIHDRTGVGAGRATGEQLNTLA